jgi:hypothetical protein
MPDQIMDRLAGMPFGAWVGSGVAAFLVLVLLVRAGASLARRRWRVTSVRARVVAKRAATYGQSSGHSGRVYTSYFATFEAGNGDRMEFHVPDGDYGMLVEGDEGLLTHRGSRWHGFDRRARGRGTSRRKPSRARAG